MPINDFISVYQKLTGSQTTADPRNPYLQQGQSVPQQNEFSRLMPNHPALANGLQDAALMASMIGSAPSGGTGQNIGNVASAMLNLPMARLQHQLAPQLAAQAWQDKQAELDDKRMSSFGQLLQGNYWYQRPALEREGYSTDIEKAKIAAGAKSPYDNTEHVDDNGNIWKFDGKTMAQVSSGGIFSDERKRLGGATEGERIVALKNSERAKMGLKPFTADEETTYLAQHYWGPQSGARTGASTDVTTPITQSEGADQTSYKNAVFPNVNPTREELASEYARRSVSPDGKPIEGFDTMKMLSDIPAERQEVNSKVNALWAQHQNMPKKGRPSFDNFLRKNGYSPETRSFSKGEWNATTGRYE